MTCDATVLEDQVFSNCPRSRFHSFPTLSSALCTPCVRRSTVGCSVLNEIIALACRSNGMLGYEFLKIDLMSAQDIPLRGSSMPWSMEGMEKYCMSFSFFKRRFHELWKLPVRGVVPLSVRREIVRAWLDIWTKKRLSAMLWRVVVLMLWREKRLRKIFRKHLRLRPRVPTQIRLLPMDV